MHENYLQTTSKRERREIFEGNCSAFPAYYHIKYVYGKNPCGHFNYVRVGVARITKGNNVEMFAEVVSVGMDREWRH